MKRKQEIGEKVTQTVSSSKEDSSLNEIKAGSFWSVYLPFYLPSFVMIFCFAFDYVFRNPSIFALMILGIMPALDLFLPVDTTNFSQKLSKSYEKDRQFLIPLYLFGLCDYLAYFMLFYRCLYDPLAMSSPLMIFYYVVNYGLSTSIGMVVAHELIHRKEQIHKSFGLLILLKG